MADVEVTREGGVLTITLNRPDVLNALNGAVHRGHLRPRSRRAQDPSGARGRDHRRRPRLLRRAGPAGVLERRGRRRRQSARSNYHRNVLAIRALEKPVIAAVNGAGRRRRPVARARLRRAHRRRRRRASCPAFIKIGLVPDSGGTWLVRRLLGAARAFEWLTTGRRLERRGGARRGGSSPRSSPADELRRARARGGRALRRDADARRLAHEAPARRRRDATFAEQLELEAATQAEMTQTPDFARGRRSVPREARRRRSPARSPGGCTRFAWS